MNMYILRAGRYGIEKVEIVVEEKEKSYRVTEVKGTLWHKRIIKKTEINKFDKNYNEVIALDVKEGLKTLKEGLSYKRELLLNKLNYIEINIFSIKKEFNSLEK